MATDHIRYDLLTQEALRGVLRHVLRDAAKKGLPGEHHFYITFLTDAEGVRISSRMRDKFPREITIILQHQFWDLTVREDSFDVGLSFNGISEKLTVPFAAVQGFFDPSVQFGLTFESTDRTDESQNDDMPPEAAGVPPAPPPIVEEPAKLAPAPALKVVEDDGSAAPDPVGGAEVVRLDRFRKK